MGPDGLAAGELREIDAFAPILRLAGLGRESAGLVTGGEPEPSPTAAERAFDRALLKRGLAWCARHGITSIHNMDGNLYTLALLEEIEDEDALICRVRVPFHMKSFMPLAALDKARAMAERYRSDTLSSGFVKVFYDGVLESWTAAMIEDYADKPGTRGVPLFTPEHFAEVAVAADRLGLQIAVHAIGDAAVRAVLDGYQAAAAANGRRDSRHRIEHIEVIHPADIPRFRAARRHRLDAAAPCPGHHGAAARADRVAHRRQALALVLCLADLARGRRPAGLRHRLAGIADRSLGLDPGGADPPALEQRSARSAAEPRPSAAQLHRRRRLCRVQGGS